MSHHNMRMLCLAAAAWASVHALNVFMLIVPLSVGRRLFAVTETPLSHDLYAGCAGCYVVWGALAALRGAARAAIGAGAVRSAARGLLRRGASLLLRGLVLAVWLCPLPLLLGRLMDSALLLPMRAAADPSAIAPLVPYQSWALGLLAIKYVHHTLVLLPIDPRRRVRRSGGQRGGTECHWECHCQRHRGAGGGPAGESRHRAGGAALPAAAV